MKTFQQKLFTSKRTRRLDRLGLGDKEHAFAIQDAVGKSETGTLPHSAENLHAWLKTLGERYGARPVALAIEASRGAVIHALLEYPCYDLSHQPDHQCSLPQCLHTFRSQGRFA